MSVLTGLAGACVCVRVCDEECMGITTILASLV